MRSPEITVGFPVYNGSRFVRGALDSLLAQDHPSFEIVVSDNASTDDTAAICEEYERRDPRVRVVRAAENRGASWNFNRVVELATGEFFMWCAHDDLWRRDCLSQYSARLRADPSAALVYCHAQPVDSRGEPVGAAYSGFANDADSPVERFRHALEDWTLHAAVYGMYRLSALRRTRLIRIMPACDILLLIELSLWGKTLELPETLAYKRVPDAGTSYRSRDQQLEYLDPKRPRVEHNFVRSAITLEAMRGVLHAGVSPGEYARYAAVAARVMIQRGFVTMDLKEEAKARLASSPGAERLLRAARSFSGLA